MWNDSANTNRLEEHRTLEGRPPRSQPSRLLTLEEVADLTRLSPHTIRRKVREGRLCPVRIARRLLFHPDELRRFISSKPERCRTQDSESREKFPYSQSAEI